MYFRMLVKPKQRKLLTFIRYQRYLGLTDIDYSNITNCYVINGNLCSFGMQFLMLAVLIFGIYCTLEDNGNAYVDMRSTAVNKIFYLIGLFGHFIQIFIQICIRCQQDEQCYLIEMLNDTARRLKVNTLKLSLPRWLCRLWIGISLYFIANSISSAISNYTSFEYVVSAIGFHVHILRTNYIITLYTSLLYVTLVLLQEQANQLHIIESGINISMAQLANNLSTHDKLLLLCHEQMVQVFGGIFVFIELYFILDSTCICYMSSLDERFSGKEALFLLSWFLPLSIYIAMPLLLNNLASQVSDMS